MFRFQLASRFVVLSLLAFLSSPAISAHAHCVECPIPLKTLSGVWALPEYGYIARVESYKLDTDLVEVRMKVIDSATGAIIASGNTHIRRGQKEIALQVYMLSGERMGVVITTDDEERIRELRVVK